MALTDKQLTEILSAAGVSTENIGTAKAKIMEGHTASINALREQRDEYKAAAEELPKVQKELDELKKATSDNDGFKAKYEKEHQDFEAYKSGVEKEKTLALKQKLFRQMLKDGEIDEKRHDAIIKVTDFEGLKVKDEKFADEDAVKKQIADNWSDFKVKSSTEPSGEPENPPANDGNGGKPVSRAAQLAQQYSANLYGAPKKTD